MNNILNIFQDIIRFANKPTCNPINNLSLKDRVLTSFLITILCYLCTTLLNSLLLFLIRLNILEQFTYDSSQIFRNSKENGEPYVLYLIFLIVYCVVCYYYILLLPLRKFKRNNVIVSFSLICSSLISIIISYFIEKESRPFYDIVVSIFVIVVFFCIIYYISSVFFAKKFDKLEKYWNNQFNYVFYSYITIINIDFILQQIALGNNIFSIIAFSIMNSIILIINAYSSIRIGKIESLLILFTLYMINWANLF